MKLLSFAVPCYNSAAYMGNCIRSLLKGGEDVEILIVDDGSKDETAAIADRYEQEYPSIVKAIHKENGGHGSAVNTGIDHATGLYFKVVDSDDWVKEEPYMKILDTLRALTGGQKVLDMLISNFVYEKVGEDRRKVMRYKHALPEGEIFTWSDVKHFRVGQYMLMHSVIFRTKLLRECGMRNFLGTVINPVFIMMLIASFMMEPCRRITDRFSFCVVGTSGSLIIFCTHQKFRRTIF